MENNLRDKINFEYVGKLNVSPLKKEVKKINNWDEYQFRQKTYEVHKHTKTIPIIFDEDFRNDNPTYCVAYSKYKKHIKSFENFFEKKLGKGYIIRAILVNLLANNKIQEHIDSGDSLSKCKRIHIPIITNSKICFTVGEEKKNLKIGEMWKINNSKRIHSVENNSNEDRIHLIIDWITH